MPDRLTVAYIDLNAYAHNIAKIRKIVGPGVQVMAVLKANAYGHGMERMAHAAARAGASYLGVVSLGELKRIRLAGVDTPVLILNYVDAESIAEVIGHNGTITVMDESVILAAEHSARELGKHLKVHLKINTGMNRGGCEPSDTLKLAHIIAKAPHLDFEGVFTHLAESENADTSFTINRQLKTFASCLGQLDGDEILPPLIHSANSAAIIALPETHFSMVRTGIVSYGLNPFPPEHEKYELVADNFKPVLSLKTQIVFIRSLAVGEPVGYNRRWQAERQSRVALIPVGYGDGWRRSPYNAGKVLIGGQFAPIVGSVSMDQIVIDITDIDNVSTGDEVVLIGSQGDKSLTADDVATAYGTINYEVVASLADRIFRVYE